MSNYRFISHSATESKSKYKGGFIKGKNTSEYNHDYYIHNKEKWEKDIGDGVGTVIQRVKDGLANAHRFVKNVVTNQNRSHRYLHRVTLEGTGKKKYRYFYTEEEWDRYLENLKKKEGDWSIEDDAAAVNPDYGNDGYDLNCGSCVIAYDMRRRGYDVKASKRYGTILSDVEKMYTGGKFKTFTSNSKRSHSNRFFDELGKYEDGARGIVNVKWSSPGAGQHLMNFEVSGGQVYIIDSQTGQKYSKAAFYKKEESIDWSNVKYMRTDNLEPTEVTKDFNMFEERGKKNGSKGRN